MTHTKAVEEIGVEPMVVPLPALATIAVGLFLLLSVGFLHAPVLHNGAHDTRHANGFPCH